MVEEEQHQGALARIPADRSLVEALYAGGRISKEARHYALALPCVFFYKDTPVVVAL